MTNALIVLTVLVGFVALSWLLQHAQHQHQSRPHAPWGSDAHDSDLTRILRDLDARP